MKGANRKLFRKPGLARQAIGILASSKELADQVQSVAPNMMPRQPVQKFKFGGLASLLGITPAGYEMVDEELVARPGFSGMYERMSGISDPARAREQSGIDLMKLGARIAAGQSGSTTTNVAQALTTTLDDIGKNRQTEFAMTLKEAELARALEDAQATKDYRTATLRMSGMPSALKEAVTGTGGAITSEGQIMGSDGTIYATSEEYQKSLSPAQQNQFNTFFVQGTDAITRQVDRLKDETTPFLQRYSEILERAGSADTEQYETQVRTDIRTYGKAQEIDETGVIEDLTARGLTYENETSESDRKAIKKNNALVVFDKTNNTTYYFDAVTGKLLFDTTETPKVEEDLKDDPKDDPKDDSKDDPKDDSKDDPNLSELSSTPELSEIAADLQLTDAEQTMVQSDRMLTRLKKELERSKANLEAALAGTKKLDPDRIQQVIERQQRQIDDRLRKLYAGIPRQRQLSLLKGNRRGKTSPSTDSTTIAQDSSTTGG